MSPKELVTKRIFELLGELDSCIYCSNRHRMTSLALVENMILKHKLEGTVRFSVLYEYRSGLLNYKWKDYVIRRSMIDMTGERDGKAINKR